MIVTPFSFEIILSSTVESFIVSLYFESLSSGESINFCFNWLWLFNFSFIFTRNMDKITSITKKVTPIIMYIKSELNYSFSSLRQDVTPQ